ncbi:ScbR family autoregulator-binding transcription factor [Streptacidiphilus anmyonensis]|uniref:ScbR family autoregulator-binding transcription factor n=1 Tax=Streptacidiphilus anmyonensis TaxID=405782 RepID=UPI0005A92EF1|nr:ScbR family autoregulator-binding transcription factor [Streptacidiphilus anmyonensis]
MAKQDRAIRTRRAILSAAARVFEERGYQAATIAEILEAAGVTKGALYFHFSSKEELAQGVLAEQDQAMTVPPRTSKSQELVDVAMLHAYRLQSDPMVRAGVRLSLDQLAHELDRSGPFLRWTTVVTGLLEQARAQSELLPHVVLDETAEVMVGSFAGVQAMSQAVTGYRDLPHRMRALLLHLLPSVVVPSVVATLDLSPHRGQDVFEELAETEEELTPSTAGQR